MYAIATKTMKENKNTPVYHPLGQKISQNKQNFATIQRKFSGKAHSNQDTPPPVQKQENRTGLPGHLKTSIETLSGITMDNVKVHYNSGKPAQLQAHAYTKGTYIHIAPGQEKHLPHEAWHVVQQQQGRVNFTACTNRIGINDNPGLENEATRMGNIAATRPIPMRENTSGLGEYRQTAPQDHAVVQRMKKEDELPSKDDYTDILQSSKWFTEAEAYENRLGTYTYHHPRSENALNAGIKKIHSVIKTYYDNPENYTDILRTAFFKNEKTSAGQVGVDLDVDEMLAVLTEGNHRERMTAFYNAAYFAAGYGKEPHEGFKAILHDIVFSGDKEKAMELDLNQEALEEQMSFYRDYSNLSGWMRSGAEFILSLSKKDKAYLFSKDIYALGNLSLQSSAWDLKEIAESQKDRYERDESEKDKFRKTPADYTRMGAPLSERELAYAFPKGTKANKESILPWLEGIAYFNIKPGNSWYKKFHDELRMPVVAGVSGTTTRMLTTYKFLNPGKPLIDFRLAIMGWMLTSWDHSLYEILRGSHIAGLIPSGEKERLDDVIQMYMIVLPLLTPELRENVAKNRMFPHELIYSELLYEVD